VYVNLNNERYQKRELADAKENQEDDQTDDQTDDQINNYISSIFWKSIRLNTIFISDIISLVSLNFSRLL